MESSDISELRRALTAETRAREHLQRELTVRNCALDAASSHFMILDMAQPGWPIVFANLAIARDHGYEPRELLGRSASILIHDSSARERVLIDEAIREGRSLRTELRGLRKNGSTFWVGIFLAPVHNATAAITHYVAVGADITKRLADAENQRRLQEQLVAEMRERERMGVELQLAQKLESVGRLAAGIAHEINTPVQYVSDSLHFIESATTDLSGLLAAYRAALSRPLTEAEAAADLPFLQTEVPRAFERMRDGLTRVAEIVRALREFAHPDADEQGAADINHALQTTLTVTRNEYKYIANIETHLGELPPVVCGIGQMNQVFLNLIVNAAHAIDEAGKSFETGGVITVTTCARKDIIEVSIADNGCGIAAEHLDKIFDPFFTTKAVGKGTGQGLAIARTIVVTKHGGELNVESAVGQGTRFTIRLPIHGRANEEAA
jgi:two-component system, NtrC family, sensor kinase